MMLLATEVYCMCAHLATVFTIKMMPSTSHTEGMILVTESSWMLSCWYTWPQKGAVTFSVPFPLTSANLPPNPVSLVMFPPKSVVFTLNRVSLFPILLIQESVAFAVQLAVVGSIGPVMRLDTGRSALVSAKTKTVKKNVFLNPMYFGMDGNTITWREERDRRLEEVKEELMGGEVRGGEVRLRQGESTVPETISVRLPPG